MTASTFTRRGFLAAASLATAVPALAGAMPEPRFTPEQVRGDLDAIWSALLDVGPQPFRTADRMAVEALYKATRAAIAQPMSIREAWIVIAPVLGALNDGHVGLGFPNPLDQVPRLFPLRFVLSSSNDVIVIGDRTGVVPIGSRLVSVEGISSARFRALTPAAFGGQTPTLHRKRVSMAGTRTAVALFGDRPTYRVRWANEHGAMIAASIPQHAFIRSGSTPQLYTYATLRGGSIGYIDYRSCEDLAGFKQFLATTFSTIRENPVQALIIDIRKNGGGHSDLNDVLWTYLTTKPFKQFGGMIEKSCDRLKHEYGLRKYVEIYGVKAWFAPNGTILESGTDPNADLIGPVSQPLRYHGPVYLLISAETFSSAMSCALAAKDYGLATIVGEETGEPVNSTGEVYTETAPATGLRAYLTTKVFLAPKPHPSDQGVVPDVVVATTPEDIATRRDPVLERTLAMISSARPA